MAIHYGVKPLAIHTPIYHDESISSWLIRVALNQGSEPLILTSYYWPKHRLWAHDLDRGLHFIDIEIYDQMAMLYGDITYNFFSHSLDDYLYLVNTKHSNTGIMPWTLPRSSRNRKYRIGQSFCPQCLENKDSCYLKKDWRLSWCIGCLTHKTLLHSQCGCCGSLYQPHLLTQGYNDISSCHKCGTEVYANSDLMYMTNKQIDMQQRLCNIQVTGKGTFLGKTVSTHEWFMILRYFINLLRKSISCSKQHSLAFFIKDLGCDLNNISSPRTGLRFELLLADERLGLLELAYQIMQLTKETFESCLWKRKYTQNMFKFDSRVEHPQILENYFQLLPKILNCSNAKRKSTKFISHKAMAHKWERLKRQYNMMTK